MICNEIEDEIHVLDQSTIYTILRDNLRKTVNNNKWAKAHMNIFQEISDPRFCDLDLGKRSRSLVQMKELGGVYLS